MKESSEYESGKKKSDPLCDVLHSLSSVMAYFTKTNDYFDIVNNCIINS